MVNHSNRMVGVLKKDSRHPFGKIPILSRPLSIGIKKHLTLDVNTLIPSMTGIPQHFSHLCKINTIKDCCKEIMTAVLEFKGKLSDSVSQALDDKVEESGAIMLHF